MNTFPSEIKQYIASFLDAKHLGHLAKVSKEWRLIASGELNKRAFNFGYRDISEILNKRHQLLEQASRIGNEKFIKFLIELDVNINQFYAVEEKIYSNIYKKYLVRINTPLTLAIEHGHLNVVKLFLKFGANPNLDRNYTDKEFYIRPALVCVHSKHQNKYAIAKLLLKHNANPNDFADYASDATALDFAIQSKDSELVKLLFEKGELEVNNALFEALASLNLQGLTLSIDTIKSNYKYYSQQYAFFWFKDALEKAGVTLIDVNNENYLHKKLKT